MPDQHNRFSALLRLSALCAAVLIATQVAVVPASAAPARDDADLTVAPTDAEDEGAVEPVEESDDEAATPAHDEDEPAAEPGEVGDEATADPVQTEDEAATLEPVHLEEATDEPAAQPDDQAVSTPAPEERSATTAPVQLDDEVADAFLMRLLDAINARRDRNGTRRLSFIPARANAALEGFLDQTISHISWPGPCGHHLVDGAFSWDFVLATGFGGAPGGEVLACPGPEPYWTPDRIAEQWWSSPIHFDVLYADGDASSIACSAHGVRDGANQGGKKRTSSGSPDAASAVLCVTFRG